MSLANNGGAPSTSLTDDRLSSRATTYYRWFDNRYCPASRPEQVANPNLLGVTAVSAPGLQPVATDASSTDISWASASTPPIVSVSVTELQRDPGTRERFLSVAERQIGVFDAAQRRAGTGDNPSTVVNIATPAKPDSDPADSTTWSPRRKWLLTCLVGVTMFNGSFASTAPNGASIHIVHQFGLSNEELAFVASSFVGGCVAGPIIWSPMSEVYGRRPVFLISNLLYSLTNIGCALAPNKAVLFNSRFLAGVFSSSAFSNAAAVTTDLFAPPHRAFPMVVVSLSPLLGPCFGPLFGSVVSLDLRWPWVFWFMGALGLVLQVALLFLPETYAPILIVRAKPRQIIATPVRTRRQRIVTLLVVNLARPVSIYTRYS
ncbi:multidrug transporter [Pseudozyma hubeiensis SY62]|uniref:Multidrug transporter n=1 Tax=Pseudozyma hubeiensis (strain SY62) TaxID=1305764 RepID=R9P8U4_PSEHS|nr:multidrug transporter [Pseudozyma hubeiensis SY62]GAC97776.1 multidrug transporter [Pseudozyma hubeiensis SY62]